MPPRKGRAWDDDSLWGKIQDYILPNPQEWGIDKESRENRTRARELNDSGWSSGIIHFADNRQMVWCCLCGGSCIQHGHNQDLMDNTGCCIPCMEACVPGCCCWELHRTRKDLRTRLGIKGVWFIDLCLVCLCPCLTTCQETRELEARAGRAWHPVWGFRLKQTYHSSFLYGGPDPFLCEILCGEDRLTQTVPFVTNKDGAAKGGEDAGGGRDGGPDEDDEDRQAALGRLQAASILPLEGGTGNRPGTEEGNAGRMMRREASGRTVASERRGSEGPASGLPGAPQDGRAALSSLGPSTRTVNTMR